MGDKLLLPFSYCLAAIIRLLLMFSEYQETIANHIEVSTPLNSWKRVVEGLVLLKHDVDPYSGDRLHEAPCFLYLYKWLTEVFGGYLPLLFVTCDLLTAHLLFTITKTSMFNMFVEREQNKKNYAPDVRNLLQKGHDFLLPPYYVVAVYLFNPFTVFNCVGQTTTVFCNLFLALFLVSMIGSMPIWIKMVLCTFALSVVGTHSFYPLMLVIPLILQCVSQEKRTKWKWAYGTFCCACLIQFLVCSPLLTYFWRKNEKFDFIGNTFEFILYVPDLHPNIGLFWYFFIEMFDHFRSLFIYSFQINATILYLIPLALRFRRDPLLLSVSLLSLINIFKSYPSIGDLGFTLSLYPLWSHLFNYTQQGFLVGVNFLISTALGPIVWHLWIYSRSANANFYFGVTLAFAVAQIFLITDILFAYIKREFSLKVGRIRKVDGDSSTLLLE